MDWHLVMVMFASMTPVAMVIMVAIMTPVAMLTTSTATSKSDIRSCDQEHTGCEYGDEAECVSESRMSCHGFLPLTDINLFHGRPPLSEYNVLILARLVPSGAVHTNR